MAAPKNQPPTVTDAKASLVVEEDGQREGRVVAGDPEGGALTWRLATKPRRGTVTLDAKTGAYTYAPAQDFHGTDAFTVDVSDGKLKGTAELSVTVTPVNDAPVATPLSLSTAEDTAVKGLVAARDLDGDALTWKVQSPPARGQATVDAKGAVTFTPAPDTHGAERFVVEVSDGALTATAEVRVTVTPVNDAPVAPNLTVTLDEDSVAQGQVAATDADGDTLTWRLGNKPRRGTLTLDAKTGAYSYTPAKEFHGDDAFTVDVSDGRLKATAAVTVKVVSVNDAPVTAPLALTTAEDTAVRGVVSGSDVDGDKLTWRISAPPKTGQATVDARGGVVFTPAPNAHGAETFVVEVSDGALTASSEVRVTVTPVNDAPVAAGDVLKVQEDGRLEGKVVATDVDGDVLTWRVVTPARHAAVTVDSKTGAFTYVPTKDFHGSDGFSVEVSDGALKVTPTVAVTVVAVNDAPVAAPLSLSTAEDTAVRGLVLGSDVDQDDVLRWRIHTPPAQGTATIDARGQVTYSPARDFNGADTFVVEVSDTVLTGTAEVRVAVSPVNDAPVAPAVTFTVKEDEHLKATVAASDIDQDALTWKLAGKGRGDVTLDARTGAFDYLAPRDFHGDDAFTVEVSDGKLKATAAVSVKVTPVNDAPVAAPLALSTSEDTAVRGTLVGSDIDGDKLSWRVQTQPARGQATIDARGVLTFTPAPDANGADTLVVEVSDGALTGTAEVRVAVAPVNDAPLAPAAAVQTDEDTPLEGTVEASDVDGDVLTWKLVAPPRRGKVSVDGKTGAFTYTPAKDLHGADTFTVDASDGTLKATATLTVTVVPVNDAPVASPLSLSTAEDTAVRGVASASDIDGDKLAWRVQKQPAKGQATIDAKGGVTFTPALNANGPDAFVVEVSDGKLTGTAEVKVTVSAVDDPPAVPPATLTLLEDAVTEATLPGSDPDGDPLTFRLTSQPRLGAAEILNAVKGTWRFSPRRDVNGEDELGFEVSDGKTMVPGTLKLVVTPVNDAPVLAPLALKTLEDSTVEGTLQGTDVEKDRLTYAVASPPASGKAVVVDAATGRIRYEPAANHHGVVTFTATASDGKLTSPPATVTVTIAPQNDAPVAADASFTTDEDTMLTGKVAAVDIDQDKLVFAVARAPQHGVLRLIDPAVGSFAYTPAEDFNGADAFTFSATDPDGASSSAMARVTVKPVNDLPVGVRGSISAPYRGSATGRVQGHDRESRAVTYRIVKQPDAGRVQLTDEKSGTFTFTSPGTQGGAVSFYFEVFDGELTSLPVEFVVQIRNL